MKIVRIMVHRPSVLNHLQQGAERHLVREEEAPAVLGLNEEARRM